MNCNIITISLTIIKLLNLCIKLIDIQVIIAKANTYCFLDIVSIIINIVKNTTIINAIISLSNKIFFGLDWMIQIACMLDNVHLHMSINLYNIAPYVILLSTMTMTLEVISTPTLLLILVAKNNYYNWSTFHNFCLLDNQLCIKHFQKMVKRSSLGHYLITS